MSSKFWHTRYSQQANWTSATREYLFKKSGITPDSKVLDVGCGTGAVLSTLQPCKSIGLDINFDYLDFANSTSPKPILIQADAYDCPFPDSSFDIVFFHYFLLWIDEPLKILREITRLLRKNGSIIACAEPDYSGRIDYPEKLKIMGDLQTKSLVNQGADPFIGKRLPYLFSQLDITISEFGVINGSWQLPYSLKDVDLEWRVIEKDLSDFISSAEVQKYKDLELEAIKDKSFVRFIPTFFLIANKN